MTNFYIAAAWVATFGIVGAYAVSVIVRGRRLSAVVPAGRQRWMADRGEPAQFGAGHLGTDHLGAGVTGGQDG